MPTYLHPGVYIEEVPSGLRPLEAVGTSTAAFLGFACKGPLATPTLVFSFDQYVDEFGGLRDLSRRSTAPHVDHLGHAVRGFFLNGGTKAYVVRLAEGVATATTTIPVDDDGALALEATSPGAWANDVAAELLLDGEAGSFELLLGRLDPSGTSVVPDERFEGAGVTAEAIAAALADQSAIVHITSVATKTSADTAPSGPFRLVGGDDGGAANTTTFEAALGPNASLAKTRDASIIALPGRTFGKGDDRAVDRAIYAAAIAHAERAKNRMVLIDPAPNVELATQLGVQEQCYPASTYAALYYPWVKIANPFFDPAKRPGQPRLVLVPPCGLVAGIWAKTDAKRGVWKAPAGLEARLGGIAGTAFEVGDAEQGQLNPSGVNCLRKIVANTVVWGARTRGTRTDPEWRYVPVRRTAMLIEESIFQGIQWAVFEPNNHLLWASLRTNIGAFMNGLFRAGAFQGEKASDAYFVRCGLGDTMVQADINRGQVIVLVGFAPVRPAEFVIVRIQQKLGQEQG